jgi:hypothetical protein
MHEIKPLFRSVNSRTHGIVHGGGDYAWSRNTKAEQRNEAARGSMRAGRRNGRDYTPLFKFLLSQVGKAWADVRSRAVARLDSEAPIFWLVARSENERKSKARIGESTYWSGLYIDEQGHLAIVDPCLSIDDLTPECPCCTHTFNGEPFTQKYAGRWPRSNRLAGTTAPP